jgi:hypothetical protein
MLKKPGGRPTELEFVSTDELVLGDHLLRKVERAVDFSFIRERVAGLYCADNGRQVNPAGHNILILDNASFHKVQSLNWGKIESWFLPPYSPELNPIEEVWLLNKTTNFYYDVAHSQEQLENKVADALRQYMNQPLTIQSVANMSAYF